MRQNERGKTVTLLKHLRTTTLVLATTLCAVAAHAQTSTWKIDSSHSGIGFQIRHLTVSTVRGTFARPTGIVKLDEKDITKSSVEASIDANTVSTNWDKRDAHLKSADFFDVEKNPKLLFKSTSFAKVNGQLQMTGDLTMNGVTKPVMLVVDGPAAPQKGNGGNMVSGISATGTIHRADFNFGTKYGPSILSEDVKFTIDIEMAKQ